MQRIGFIGLGTMGLPMARNLAQCGTPLQVWNRTSKTAAEFPTGCDIEFSPSARAVLRDTQTCILMLLNEDTVDLVLERGSNDFVENVRGTTIIAMGSVDPAYSSSLATEITSAGGTYIEAPVSGSQSQAELGQLVCMLAGPLKIAEAAEPILGPMCKDVIYCGGAGDALRMKLAINLYLCSSLVALAEATNFARLAGISMDKFSQALSGGPLRSDFVTIKLPKMISGDFALQAGVADAYKSTCLIRAEAQRLSAATPQLDLGSELYACAVERLGSKVDMSSVIEVLR